MKHCLVRPKLSIIVFNKDNKSVKPIVDSLSALPDLMRRLLEFTFVVYDKTLTKENEQLTLSLRRYMKSGFKDYNPRHKDLPYYGVAKKQIEKNPEDVITESEIRRLIVQVGA